ncbi:25472_t:CDS:2, partial [Gigaspora margarita]
MSPTMAEEKEWLLLLADLVFKGQEDQLLESDNPDVYDNEGLGPEEETTEKYYKWMEKLNQKFKRVLTWSEHDAMEESWKSGVKFSNSKNNWDNDWLCGAKTWLGTGKVWRNLEGNDNSNHGWGDIEYEIFMVEEENKCEVLMMNEDKESKSEEGLEDRLSKKVIKKLNGYRSRTPQHGPLMSPFPNPTEKEFCIEEYDEELKKQKKEGNEYVKAELIRNSTPRKDGVEACDDDDKTVQGEEDLLKPLPDTVNEQIPRTIFGFPSVRPSNLPGSQQSRSIELGKKYLHNRADGIPEYFFSTGIDLGHSEPINTSAVQAQLRKDHKVLTLESTDGTELMELIRKE